MISVHDPRGASKKSSSALGRCGPTSAAADPPPLGLRQAAELCRYAGVDTCIREEDL